ncbi:MAG: hypothetical protein GXX78_07425 [Bacteroidales bacterium]|nr:hypothetical protein [Bacteroidales bacterium]
MELTIRHFRQSLICLFSLIPIFSYCEIVFDVSQVHEIPRSETEALLSIYESLNGDNWKCKRNWLGRPHPSIGELISLKSNNLSENNFSGTIPTEIANHKEINRINHSNNQFDGSIPLGITNLENLNYLNLSGNTLSLILPKEIFQMKNLRAIIRTNDRLPETNIN